MAQRNYMTVEICGEPVLVVEGPAAGVLGTCRNEARYSVAVSDDVWRRCGVHASQMFSPSVSDDKIGSLLRATAELLDILDKFDGAAGVGADQRVLLRGIIGGRS